MRGEEKELTGSEPVTHLFYFASNLTKEGRLGDVPPRPDIAMDNGRRPEVHLVIAELSNDALMHFSLDPQYGVTPLLVQDIFRAAGNYDGIQIDFESVPRDDADHFLDFLKALKLALPAGKMLSIAVPARTAPRPDAYDYIRVSAVVDRVVIMAYDEHWSTSSPGPVASLPWCSRVLDFAMSTIESGKIVMGLPLYGRAWPDKRLARALRFRNIQDLVVEKRTRTGYTSELGAYLQYSENVIVKVFFDDERSMRDKLDLYSSRSVPTIAFWRVGLGSPGLWNELEAIGP
jgi:spore germination protein YaaH